MWLSRLDLLAFGRFTDIQLKLGPGFHLVYGPNEAGKSTTLRAIRQLLFGFDERTNDNFVHSNPNLRLGGVICDDAGNELHAIRRKTRKDSLRSAIDESVIDMDLWQKILTGIDETTFSQRYGIDYEQLVQGGHEIATGSGDLGEILFATGSGIRDLASVQKSLNEDAEKLFKPQGKKQRINQVISDLQFQREEVATKLLSIATWEEADQQRQAADSRLQELTLQLASLTDEIRGYKNWRQAKPLVAEMIKLEGELKPLATGGKLPDDFDARRQEIQLRLKQAEAIEKTASESLKSIQQERSKLSVPDDLLAKANDLKRLFSEAGANQKALQDRARLLEQFNAHEKSIADLQQNQSEQASNGKLPALDRSLMTRIHQLGRQQAGLAQALRQAESQQKGLQEQIGKIQSQLTSIPAHKPLDELKTTVREIRADGDLEARLIQIQAEINEFENEYQRQLEGLEPWHGTSHDLKSMRLPKQDEIQRWESAFESQRTEISLLEARRTELAAAREELNRTIQSLQQEFQIPQESDLHVARERRDAAWSEIRQQLISQEFPPASRLSEYEQLQSEADHLADRLRIEADRVAQLADQLAELKANEEREQELSDQARQLELAKSELIQKWHAEWPDFKVSPLLPREMLTWLTKRDNLLQHESQLSRRRIEADSLIEKIEENRSRLTQQLAGEVFNASSTTNSQSTSRRTRESTSKLARTDQKVPRQQKSLFGIYESTSWDFSSSKIENGDSELSINELLASAEKQLEQSDEHQRNREQASESLSRLSVQEAAANDEIRQAKSQLAEWQTEWNNALRPLSIDPDQSPETAIDAVGKMFEAADQRNQAAQLRKRIDDINEYEKQFQASVDLVCQQIAPDLIGLEADQAVTKLQTRLANGLRDQIKASELISQNAAAQRQLADAHQSWSDAIENLDELCRLAQIDFSDRNQSTPFESNAFSTIFGALSKAAEQSRQTIECERRRESVRKQLAELADPELLETFIDRVQNQTLELIAERLKELEHKSAEMGAERDRLNHQLGSYDQQLKQMDGSAEAAEAQEKLQLSIAQIRSNAEQYVRIKLASSVLSSAIERYREKIRGPVLTIASELFRELTLNSFESLQIDEDEQNRPILVGLRTGSREPVPVTGMSEGTCDQLYLALRLASLQLESPPRNRLPFIVDDILIQFDDARATAALRTLSRIAQQRQVIYFTHHEHLLDIASKELRADCYFHRLDCC